MVVKLIKYDWFQFKEGVYSKRSNLIFPDKTLDSSLFLTRPYNPSIFEFLTISDGQNVRCSPQEFKQYTLKSIVLHEGNNPYEGHYTAECYRDGHWVHFNDEKWKIFDRDKISNGRGHLFFYS